ncbi:MAG: UDP-N-acetylmuramoyl-tripeptide--D-alanyl-D-alanine ligase [Deltaproteobacteria bacterium]|nr:UDP-N-acetylmuramoyl-tripeptide--D-alanyl-D-alanine ligase [Deltaproteobacteria bacterium]
MMRTSTFRLSGEFVAESCGGRLVIGEGVVAEAGVAIDSRTIQPREAFVAIRGPRFDGHRFLSDATARGAVGLVVEEPAVEAALAAARASTERAFVVAVDDTTRALQALATAWVAVLQPIVVGVTGSVGKTTTKDMTAAVLAARFDCHATGGNRNNNFGLSLTCLKLVPSHEVLVAEMGMNAPGEIRTLATIAPPRIGVVTTVAPVHLEGLGTIEAVADAKAELVESLGPEGCAVLNADDPRVAAMRGRTGAGRVLTFGVAKDADVRIAAVEVGPDGRAAVTIEAGGARAIARLQVVGAHQACNAAAAVAAGLALNVPLADACAAVGTVRAGRHRMEVVSAGTLRVLDDCYNASPKSMSAALATLASIAAGGRCVAVIGDMLELGDATTDAHLDAGREAAAAGVECLIAVGRQADLVRRGAIEAGLPGTSIFVAPDAITASSVALAVVLPRDTVLVKGSRGVGLEHVVEAMAARFAGVGAEGN